MISSPTSPTPTAPRRTLAVECSPALLEKVPEGKRSALLGVLAQDPRPSYQEDPERIYGLAFAGVQVKFMVEDGTLTVREILPEAQV